MAVLQMNPGQPVPLGFLFPLFPEENLLWGLMSRGFLRVRCPCSVPQPHWRKHKALFQPEARPFFIHHQSRKGVGPFVPDSSACTMWRQTKEDNAKTLLTAEKATDTNSYKSTFWSQSIPRTHVQQQQSMYVWSCCLNFEHDMLQRCRCDSYVSMCSCASVVS